MENNKTPSIRFKGFTDPWEQRKLGDILISLQNNTLSRADLSNEAGVAKNVHYGDVLIKFGEVLDVSKEKLPMISDESVLSKYKSSFLQNGDVIVADTAEDSTVGKCSEIAGLNDEVVLSGLHTIPYRPIEKFASGYLGYYLNSSAYHNHLIPLMQGIKVTSISKSAMQDTDIVYPKSVEEQGKIGDYFQSLDHLITLHQRKYNKLLNVKKSMLEKMFPKNGSNIPEIRFKGFTDPWEQRKVSEVSEIVAGGTPSTSVSEYWEPKEVPWLSSGEVHKKYITYTDDMISKNGLANSSAKIIKKNSVLIALAGQGKTRGTVAINRISLSTNQSIAAMSFNDDIVPEFVFSNLENRHDEIRAMSSGDGSRGGLNKQLVGDITIPYTIKEEQQKIGQYFSNLDHLITLHQRELEKLQNIKKSMLEKMFV